LMKIIRILIIKNNVTLINSYGLYKITANNLYTNDILANTFRRNLINNFV